jgi:anti-sigma factor RsiW
MKHAHGRDPECLKIFERLSEYIDGELSPEDCEIIRAHIEDCEPCIDFIESLKRSIAASRCVACPEKPEPLPPETLERLRSAWQTALARRH